jgi:acid phosphatase family membrane protein YuiD
LEKYVNPALLISASVWVLAQVLKFVGGMIREKRIDLSYFIRPGGMPSAHSALVTSLAVSIGVLEGFNSTAFAISAIFAMIVLYDAAGVRRSVSRQSIILNRILIELREKRPKDFEHDVRELIGHTPIQVFTGGILGIAYALFWLWLSGNLKF